VKILLVNVNTTTAATEAMVAAALVKASPGTEVMGLTPSYGSAGVDSNAQSLLAAVGVMDAVLS
jgi:allantoin racemase